jgi:predicted ATPase/class 3 adenylate cyclase
MVEQPTGTVTLLFTDIEGSTRLLERLGPERYREGLDLHRRLLRAAFERNDAYEVDHEGDAFFVSFRRAEDAVAAAAQAQQALAATKWSEGDEFCVRMGVHTGEPLAVPPKYVGLDVHIAARIMAAGHGGQVLLSRRTVDLLDGRFEMRDLGEHRLKDLGDPVWLFQLGEAEFPPLRSLNYTNLPSLASSFVGRARELAEAEAQLRTTRLLTVTGAGGAGKTRFAIELAGRQLERFPNGVFWMPLADLRDPSLVLERAAQTLGAKEGLAGHISDKRLLLLFDNFEQLVEAAPGLVDLLQTCPNLRVIVTSRETLRVQGESEYTLPPIAEEEGVALFCDRAGVAPSGSISMLCRRLDGLPLAIELAAARSKLLSPEQIVERLAQRLDLFKGGRDAEPRQKTLRATISWSYDLLNAEDQSLFTHLAVFVGGCRLEAAEAVCGAKLDTLQSLLEKSLIRRSSGRYWMLETVREYALERLGERYEAGELRDRHAQWYALQLSQRELAVRDQDLEAFSFVQAELENARAALTYALQQHRASQAALLLWGTFSTWLLCGRAVEGARCAEETLAANLRVSGVERVCLLAAAGDLLRFAGEHERARRLKNDALAAAQPLVGQMMPGGRTVAAVLVSLQSDLADLALMRDDLEAARAYSRAAVAAARGGNDARALARALGPAMWTAFAAGDPDQALTVAAEALELDTRDGRAVDAAESLILISLCQLQLGDADGAASNLATAIGRVRQHPGRSFVLINLFVTAGRLALARGRPDDAEAFGRLASKLANDQAVILDPAMWRVLNEVQQVAPPVTDGGASAPPLTEDEALQLLARLVEAR